MTSYVALKGCSVSTHVVIPAEDEDSEDITRTEQVVLKRGEAVPKKAPPEKVKKLVRMGLVVDASSKEGKKLAEKAKAEEAREVTRLRGKGDPSTDRSKTVASEGGKPAAPAVK